MFALRSIISPPQSLLANKESKLEEIDPLLLKKNVGKLVRNNLTITYFTPTIEIYSSHGMDKKFNKFHKMDY